MRQIASDFSRKHLRHFLNIPGRTVLGNANMFLPVNRRKRIAAFLKFIESLPHARPAFHRVLEPEWRARFSTRQAQSGIAAAVCGMPPA